ncbi:MAG: hypothetical protein N2645_22785 [Clostridia bacterium]|nr:hypothetical protein [Clostridia bacterium]
MKDLDVLIPRNARITRGKLLLITFIGIFVLLELFATYSRFAIRGTDALFSSAIRISLTALLMYKTYRGNRGARVITVILLGLSILFSLAFWDVVFNNFNLASMFTLAVLIYYGAFIFLLTLSPSVKEFLLIQRNEENPAIFKKYDLEEGRDWIWTWGGRFFGYLEGEYLWSYTGKNIGKISGNDVYNASGAYIGEICYHRLVTNLNKKSLGKTGYHNFDSKSPVPKAPDIPGYDLVDGFEDFPKLED